MTLTHATPLHPSLFAVFTKHPGQGWRAGSGQTLPSPQLPFTSADRGPCPGLERLRQNIVVGCKSSYPPLGPLYHFSWVGSNPTVKCIGGTAGWDAYTPKFIQCQNKGWDGYDVQWECKTDLDIKYKFGKTARL